MTDIADRCRTIARRAEGLCRHTERRSTCFAVIELARRAREEIARAAVYVGRHHTEDNPLYLDVYGLAITCTAAAATMVEEAAEIAATVGADHAEPLWELADRLERAGERLLKIADKAPATLPADDSVVGAMGPAEKTFAVL